MRGGVEKGIRMKRSRGGKGVNRSGMEEKRRGGHD